MVLDILHVFGSAKFAHRYKLTKFETSVGLPRKYDCDKSEHHYDFGMVQLSL